MELGDFRAGKDLAKLVKWEDTNGWVHGIIEAQRLDWFRIYVFRVPGLGSRMAPESACAM